MTWRFHPVPVAVKVLSTIGCDEGRIAFVHYAVQIATLGSKIGDVRPSKYTNP
jgi:hypothetical protein